MASFFFNHNSSVTCGTIEAINKNNFTMGIDQLIIEVQRKGFKVEHYESPVQFQITIQKKDQHVFSRIYVGANILKRMETKNESSLKMLELLNQN